MHELYQYRQAAAANVRFAQRLIDVLAVPYDTPTTIVDYDGEYVETIDPHAFDGVEVRANRVKVLRDHSRERVVGKAHALYPGKADGLHATLRIARTDLGEETLELADEGVLDVSIGFAPLKDGSVWDRARTAVHRTKLLLAEISFVPFPAYEGAVVAGVRHEQTPSTAALSATPNLDAVRAQLALARYSAVS